MKLSEQSPTDVKTLIKTWALNKLVERPPLILAKSLLSKLHTFIAFGAHKKLLDNKHKYLLT